MPDIQSLDLSLTINELVLRHPETVEVFNRFGLDTCCGGGVTAADAARRDGVDPAAVVAELCRSVQAQ